MYTVVTRSTLRILKEKTFPSTPFPGTMPSRFAMRGLPWCVFLEISRLGFRAKPSGNTPAEPALSARITQILTRPAGSAKKPSPAQPTRSVKRNRTTGGSTICTVTFGNGPPIPGTTTPKIRRPIRGPQEERQGRPWRLLGQ